MLQQVLLSLFFSLILVSLQRRHLSIIERVGNIVCLSYTVLCEFDLAVEPLKAWWYLPLAHPLLHHFTLSFDSSFGSCMGFF